MAAQQDEWLTVAEACDYLKITRATLYRWAHDGRLRLFKAGGRVTRLRRAEIAALLTPKQTGYPQEHVTVVGREKSQVFGIGPGMETVKDAVERFMGHSDNHVVFRNQEPVNQFTTPLESGDVIVVLPRTLQSQMPGESDNEIERSVWLKLAESSFNRDWDNEHDAIYDNWRELYGVRDR
jgi:excisionase family DNA binding protein